MIYFVESKELNAVKIGWVKSERHLASRISQLQIGCPCKLMLIRSIDGTRRDEKRIHRELKSSRIRGEWFRMSAELLRRIKSIEANRKEESFDETSDFPDAETERRYWDQNLRICMFWHAVEQHIGRELTLGERLRIGIPDRVWDGV